MKAVSREVHFPAFPISHRGGKVDTCSRAGSSGKRKPSGKVLQELALEVGPVSTKVIREREQGREG